MRKEQHIQLKYLVQLPKAYHSKSYEEWPLILFLHGAGEKGHELDIVKRFGPPKIADEKDLPFVIVSPQCPFGNRWTLLIEQLYDILKEVIIKYRVDTKRIYLTGLSMGGFGTWAMAIKFPDIFAAIAPVCGGSQPQYARKIKHIPCWVFHGENDKVIPVESSREMVYELNNLNANIKYTEYKDVGHDSWTPAYNDSELFEWFLEQKKK